MDVVRILINGVRYLIATVTILTIHTINYKCTDVNITVLQTTDEMCVEIQFSTSVYALVFCVNCLFRLDGKEDNQLDATITVSW